MQPLPPFLAITALVTPFRGRAVDQTAYEQLLIKQEQGKIRDLLLFGSTGEGLALQWQEQRELLEIALRLLAPTTRVWVGCLDGSIAQILERMSQLAPYKLAGILLPGPYLAPSLTHFEESLHVVLNQSPLPCILYNNPIRYRVNLTEEVIIRAATHPRFLALKECVNDPLRMLRVSQALGSHQYLLGGNDAQLGNVLLSGGKGAISVASNAMPTLLCDLLDVFMQGSLIEFQRLLYEWLELSQLLEPFANPRGIKLLLQQMGLINADFSQLVQPVTEFEVAAFQRGFDAYRQRSLLA